MRRIFQCLGVVFVACAAAAAAPHARAPIVVLHALESCAPGDRAYARTLARHVVSWLKDGGVAADMADDRMVETALAGRRLAYLILPDAPHASALGAYKRFIQRGGKLCVFHSKSPELGALLGVAPGAWRAAGPGGYGKIVFTCGPAGTPGAIVTSAAGAHAARPASPRTRVYGVWCAADGRTDGPAAVLGSPAGWWVTGVFGAEGDEQAKQQFLLAVAGASVPGAWHAEAWLARERARAAQVVAYARRQARRPGEIHAVWDHAGTGLYPGDWPRTVRELAALGVTDLFVNVAGAGFAHYPTSVLPASGICRARGDQLAACLAAARGTGVRVHAWILCFNATGALPATRARFARDGWCLRAREGTRTDYLNPAHPAVRAHVLAAITDVVRRYPVDGVHLDFVRWYEGAARPADAARTVTDFVAAARARVKAARPRAWLTTAVLAAYPGCIASVGQDWEAWLARGLVDFIVPMNYSEDNARVAAWLARQCRTPAQARRVIAGLGVTANESRLGAVKTIDQIRSARRAGCAGVALFDLDYTLRHRILPYLRMGLF